MEGVERLAFIRSVEEWEREVDRAMARRDAAVLEYLLEYLSMLPKGYAPRSPAAKALLEHAAWAVAVCRAEGWLGDVSLDKLRAAFAELGIAVEPYRRREVEELIPIDEFVAQLAKALNVMWPTGVRVRPNGGAQSSEVPPDVWLPIFEKFYTALSKRTLTLVYGSQIYYVLFGRLYSSKDVDLLTPNPSLEAVEMAYRETFGEEVARFEIAGSLIARKFVVHLYVPTGVDRPSYITIEIFSETHLGDPLAVFPDELVQVERGGVVYWTLTAEAYAVLTATKPGGPRAVDVARLAEVSHLVDWRRAEGVADRLGALDALRRLRALVSARLGR